VHTAAPDPGFSLTLKRNCSISPSGLLWLLGLMIATSLGIAVAFAIAGAWMILPFAGLEVLALVAAFYLHGRHAGDYERLAISGGRLRIEVRDGETVRRSDLDRAWVRLRERESGRDYRIAIVARGEEIEIGRHLDGERRRELAATLRAALLDTKAKGREKR
jgi:uncharacterized membrane protein